MNSSIPRSYANLIRNATTCKQAWDNLEQYFTENLGAPRYFARRQLTAVTITSIKKLSSAICHLQEEHTSTVTHLDFSLDIMAVFDKTVHTEAENMLAGEADEIGEGEDKVVGTVAAMRMQPSLKESSLILPMNTTPTVTYFWQMQKMRILHDSFKPNQTLQLSVAIPQAKQGKLTLLAFILRGIALMIN